MNPLIASMVGPRGAKQFARTTDRSLGDLDAAKRLLGGRRWSELPEKTSWRSKGIRGGNWGPVATGCTRPVRTRFLRLRSMKGSAPGLRPTRASLRRLKPYMTPLGL